MRKIQMSGVAGSVQKLLVKTIKERLKKIILTIWKSYNELPNSLTPKQSWKWVERKVKVHTKKVEKKINQEKPWRANLGWINSFLRQSLRISRAIRDRLKNFGSKLTKVWFFLNAKMKKKFRKTSEKFIKLSSLNDISLVFLFIFQPLFVIVALYFFYKEYTLCCFVDSDTLIIIWSASPWTPPTFQG